MWSTVPFLAREKKTKSPALRLLKDTEVPTWYWSRATLGRLILFFAKTYCTKPEQSNPDGVVPPYTYLTPIYFLPVAIIALAFDIWVDEGGGVNALVDRETCFFTCFCGVTVAGKGLLASTVTAGSGCGVLIVGSGNTAIFIALGYKFPIVVWIVFGNESPITSVGTAVIIVTNKNTEMTGKKTRALLLLSRDCKDLIFIILSFEGEQGFHRSYWTN